MNLSQVLIHVCFPFTSVDVCPSQSLCLESVWQEANRDWIDRLNQQLPKVKFGSIIVCCEGSGEREREYSKSEQPC